MTAPQGPPSGGGQAPIEPPPTKKKDHPVHPPHPPTPKKDKE